MKLGFTGTRQGLSQPQRDALYKWLCECTRLTEFHHSAEIGAPAEAVDILGGIVWEDGPIPKIIAHPSDVSETIDLEALTASDVVCLRKPIALCNSVIVESCDVLLACPDDGRKSSRGVWGVIAYAKQEHTKVVIFYPDGFVNDIEA